MLRLGTQMLIVANMLMFLQGFFACNPIKVIGSYSFQSVKYILKSNIHN